MPYHKKIAMIVMTPCTHDSRVMKEAESLVSAGYGVRVICLMRADLKQQEWINNVEYYRVKCQLFGIQYKKKSVSKANNFYSKDTERSLTLKKIIGLGIQKLIPFLKYSLTSVFIKDAVIDYSPDVIHAHDLTTLPAAVKYAKKLNIPVIYDAHELETNRANNKNPIVKWFITYTEKKYISQTTAVITVSDSIANFLAQAYTIKLPTVIYNSPDYYPGKQSISNVRSDFGINTISPLIVYVGIAQTGRGIELLLTAMGNLKEFYLAFVGPENAIYYPKYKQMISDLGLSDRVRFFPPVPSEDVVSYISTADVGVSIIQDVCLSYRYCMPNKLFEMAFARLPIVCSNLPDMKAFILKNELGIVVDQENSNLIAQGIREAYTKRNIISSSDEKLKDLINEYGWQAQAKKLLALYSDLQ